MDEGRDLAADLTNARVSPVDEPVEQAPPPAPPSAPLRPHRLRFGLLYALLAGVLGLGVAGIVLYATDTMTSAPAWSAWQPGGGGLGRAGQIAARVSRQYHLPSGEQLVEVFAKSPSVSPGNQSIPLHYIVVQRAQSNDEPIEIDSTNTVQYSLCGLGDSCAIAKGTPSVQRGTLVRREILELALYTFKYMEGIKNVIAFMPPTPGSSPKYVVLLQKEDLEEPLSRPLNETLSTKTPLPNGITSKEQQTIDATTEQRVFSFGLSQTQNGDAVLVLQPVA